MLTQKRPIVLDKIGQRDAELAQHVRDLANGANIRYAQATIRNAQVLPRLLTAALPPHAGHAPRTRNELHISKCAHERTRLHVDGFVKQLSA
jgi:hypothetical protein